MSHNSLRRLKHAPLHPSHQVLLSSIMHKVTSLSSPISQVSHSQRLAVRLLQEGTGTWVFAHAHFKGALRRLAVPVPEDYDDEEYTEATAAFFTAVKQLVTHTR